MDSWLRRRRGIIEKMHRHTVKQRRWENSRAFTMFCIEKRERTGHGESTEIIHNEGSPPETTPLTIQWEDTVGDNQEIEMEKIQHRRRTSTVTGKTTLSITFWVAWNTHRMHTSITGSMQSSQHCDAHMKDPRLFSLTVVVSSADAFSSSSVFKKDSKRTARGQLIPISL